MCVDFFSGVKWCQLWPYGFPVCHSTCNDNLPVGHRTFFGAMRIDAFRPGSWFQKTRIRYAGFDLPKRWKEKTVWLFRDPEREGNWAQKNGIPLLKSVVNDGTRGENLGASFESAVRYRLSAVSNPVWMSNVLYNITEAYNISFCLGTSAPYRERCLYHYFSTTFLLIGRNSPDL